MSVKAISWVFEHSRSRGIDRLVLLALADAANDQGTAWPSLTTIARKAGIDRRTVSRTIARLVELGELRRHPASGQSGVGGRSNLYDVVMEQGQSAPASPVGDESEQGHGAPTKQGRSAPRGRESLGAESPQVGAESPLSRGTAPPNPLEPSEPSAGRARAGAREAKPKKTRATPPPDHFEITPELRAWAAAKSITADLDFETEQFLDYHRRKGTLGQDWVAGWRSWMRNTLKFGSTAPTPAAKVDKFNPLGVVER